MPSRAANPWTFQSIDESLAMLELFPSSQVGLALDLYHVGLSNTFLDRLDEIADRICLVQIADRDSKKPGLSGQSRREKRLMPGEGNIDFDRWMASLASVGYTGPIEFEMHGPRFDDVEYVDTLRNSLGFIEAQRAKQNAGSASRI